jgi:T5SS/PEP-CTERM-associated repeat protein
MGALLRVGFGAGSTGTMSVLEGATVRIGDNGQAANAFGTALEIGRNQSSGTVLVAGAGSSIDVSKTGAGARLPGVFVGNTGSGRLDVIDGGLVRVLGGGQRDLYVGNAAGANGVLNVARGGQVSASFAAIGNAGGVGTTLLDAGTLRLDGLVEFQATSIGAGLRIGRGAGSSGDVRMINGASIVIDRAHANSSINLGGSGQLPGGEGTLRLETGSSIRFVGSPLDSRIDVGGPQGRGTLLVSGASTIDLGGSGSLQVGSRDGSVGLFRLEAGSTVNAAATLAVGRNPGDTTHGNGTAIINGVFNVGTVYNGTGGYVGGLGTLNATGAIVNEGTWNVGNTPGTMTINAASFTNGPGGRFVLEIEALPGGGFVTDHVIFGAGTALDFSGGEIVFDFLGSADPTRFLGEGLFSLAQFFAIEDGSGGLRSLDPRLFDAAAFSAEADRYRFERFAFNPSSGATFVATAVPIPATLALSTLGLVLLAGQSIRRPGAVPRVMSDT